MNNGIETQNMIREKILILAKTYPNPSSKYIETTCIAGINHEGEMRRLYPVSFRFLEEKVKFKKWQWIEANIAKATKDHRPESFKVVDRDSIEALEVIDSKKNWLNRSVWWKKIPQANLCALENSEELRVDISNEVITRISGGKTLFLIDNIELESLEIVEQKEKKWTEEELRKLKENCDQLDMFFNPETLYDTRSPLKKLPYRFYYKYNIYVKGEKFSLRSMITDWEAGAAFWKFLREYEKGWKEKFTQRFLEEMKEKDMKFLMGNMHTHQNQWLIISLIYPPEINAKNSSELTQQLFDF